MADYAYKDEERTQKIYANGNNIIKYKGIRCWCKNPNCNAKMFIVKPEYPDEAYFRASSKTPHSGSCGSECHHFDKKRFNENLFRFPNILINLEKDDRASSTTIIHHPPKKAVTGEKPIKTLRQLYSMCTNTPIDDKYGTYIIGDIIADIRNINDNSNGIKGYRIIECNFYKYDKNSQSIYFNYPCYPQNQYLVEVKFKKTDLFEEMLKRILPLKHEGIIVISGNWVLSDIEEKTKCVCEIYSAKQIAIIRKDNH